MSRDRVPDYVAQMERAYGDGAIRVLPGICQHRGFPLTAQAPTTEGVIATLAGEDLAGRRVGVQLYPGNPNDLLLDFLSTTYAAAADCGHWDRAALECPFGVPGKVRPI